MLKVIFGENSGVFGSLSASRNAELPWAGLDCAAFAGLSFEAFAAGRFSFRRSFMASLTFSCMRAGYHVVVD